MDHSTASFIPKLIVLSFLFVWPVVVGRYLARGNWRQIGMGYAMWWGFLLLVALAQPEHQQGLLIIVALFTTVFVVPILVLCQKLVTRLRTKRGQ